MLAYVTRNFLEWSLWCRFVSEAPKNMETFLTNDFGADVVDLIKFNPVLNPVLYSKVFSANEKRGPVYAAALDRAWDANFKVLKAFENDSGRPPKKLQLGFVFKLCSKLLHPTPMSILVLPNETESHLHTQRVHLRSAALYYANVGLDAIASVSAQI